MEDGLPRAPDGDVTAAAVVTGAGTVVDEDKIAAAVVVEVAAVTPTMRTDAVWGPAT